MAVDGAVGHALFCAQSDVVKVDLRAEPPAAFATIKAVGSKAHGLVEWGRFFVMLDSDNAALAIVDPSTSEVHQRWQVREGAPRAHTHTHAYPPAYAHARTRTHTQRQRQSKGM